MDTRVRSALLSSARLFSDGKFESTVLRDNGKQLERKLTARINRKVGKTVALANYIGFVYLEITKKEAIPTF